MPKKTHSFLLIIFLLFMGCAQAPVTSEEGSGATSSTSEVGSEPSEPGNGIGQADSTNEGADPETTGSGGEESGVTAEDSGTGSAGESAGAETTAEETPTDSSSDSAGTTGDGGDSADAGSAKQSTSIAGLVFHDVCGTTADAAGTLTDATPGCVSTAGSYQANGTHELSEEGLGSIVVALASGTCPGTELAEVETDSNGEYIFSDLEPGAYCVSVDSGSTPNNSTLGAGSFTTPATASSQITLELGEGDALSGIAFGWDFAELPVVDASTCTEKAAFYADLTVPDYTAFRPGDPFEKIWKIKNEGTCTWTTDYHMVFAFGNRMGGDPSISLPQEVPPGQTVDLAVEMVAPEAGGEFTGNWQLSNPENLPFGVGITGNDYIWVIITVAYLNSDGQVPVESDPPPPPSSDAACGVSYDTGFESQVLSLLNAQRSAAGLPALNLQDQLTAAARLHSADMACGDFVDHTGSDGSLWWDRISAQGYAYSNATENIYVGSPDFGGTPAGAMDWWMNSQVHRDNILDADVTEIGVGYVFYSGSSYGGYYTLVFARP